MTWDDISSNSSAANNKDSLIVEAASTIQSLTSETDAYDNPWPTARVMRRRISAPPVLQGDGRPWAKRHSAVSVISAPNSSDSSHDWSVKTSRSISIGLAPIGVTKAMTFDDIPEEPPIVNGEPTQTGLRRVNTQLSDYLDQMRYENRRMSALSDSSDSPMKDNLSPVVASPRGHHFVEYSDYEDDLAIDPVDDSHPQLLGALYDDISSPQQIDSQRRTVSWSGTVEEFGNAYGNLNRERTSSDPPVEVGPSWSRWSALSNTSRIHFQDHKDSMELYRDKTGRIRRSTTGSTAEQNRTQLRRSKAKS